MRSFIGITGHFIVDYTMKSVMLACQRFKGKHTADNISQQYHETINSFEIASKILTVVIDNASNMKKAFNFDLPGYESGVQRDKGVGDETDTESDDEMESCERVNTDHSEDLSEPDNAVYGYLSTSHTSCFIHTVQLVVHDGMKAAGPQIARLIGKASKIVSFIRSSTTAPDILEGDNRPQAANVTRWNSEVKMIRSVLAIPTDKLDKLDTATLSTYERNCLNDLCEILKPFEDATMFVQQEKSVSASLVVPCVRGLKHKMQKMSSKFNSSLVRALKDSVTKRLNAFEENDLFSVASVLDPRFKLKWAAGTEKAELRDQLIRKATNVQQTSAENCINSPPAKRQKVTNEADDLFGFMEESSPTVSSASSPVSSEVDKYLSEPCTDRQSNPLQYWSVQQSNFPRLAELACTYLCIPASSAPVERIFSVAGKVFRPDRCQLKDKTFEQLMFIRCNLKE